MSTITIYAPSYNQRNHNLRPRHGSHAPLSISRASMVPTSLHGYSLLENQGWQLLRASCTVHTRRKTTMKMNASNKLQPESPLPPKSHFRAWINRIVGWILSVLLPSWKSKWEQLLRLEDKLEMVVDGAEEVAENAEHMIEVVADKLPNGGNLKNTALALENVAEEVVRDTHLASEFIHKVKEVESDVETIIEPDADQAEGVGKEA